jgi:hypothetical protein
MSTGNNRKKQTIENGVHVWTSIYNGTDVFIYIFNNVSTYSCKSLFY